MATADSKIKQKNGQTFKLLDYFDINLNKLTDPEERRFTGFNVIPDPTNMFPVSEIDGFAYAKMYLNGIAPNNNEIQEYMIDDNSSAGDTVDGNLHRISHTEISETNESHARAFENRKTGTMSFFLESYDGDAAADTVHVFTITQSTVSGVVLIRTFPSAPEPGDSGVGPATEAARPMRLQVGSVPAMDINEDDIDVTQRFVNSGILKFVDVATAEASGNPTTTFYQITGGTADANSLVRATNT